MAENEAIRRLQASIDMLKERMRIDSNDLEYESHLRQKRQLQRILTACWPRKRMRRNRSEIFRIFSSFQEVFSQARYNTNIKKSKRG